ncbi:MAG: alpha/beta fold hydrolase, partial [Candidatus Helarchaeota archaeon]
MANLKYKSINLHYTIQGSGPAIVLLHGFLENVSMWHEIIPHLTKKHRVICIDLLGHGLTGNLGYIHTMEEQSKMVKFILNYLKLRKYIFIGHSMGGYISLAFSELFPKNIKKLCLMNSSAQPDDVEKRKNRDRAIRAVKHSPKTFVKLAIPNLFSEANKTNFAKEIELITQEALQTSPQGIIAAMEGMKIREDRTSILNSSVFPILMVISKL